MGESSSRGASAFDIVDLGDGPVQAGIAYDVANLSQTKTFILVGQPPEPSGDQVAVFAGLWEPAVESEIKLGKPNRNGRVYAVVYELVGNEIASFVYVHDPATHPESKPRPMVALT